MHTHGLIQCHIFFQLSPSFSQKIKVCLSLVLFLSHSVYASSLREHNYQHRTITPFPVKMRQFPVQDSFHALTIPPGIMAHKEAQDHFRTCYIPTAVCERVQDSSVHFSSFLLLFSFPLLSSYRRHDLPLFRPTLHPSVHPTIYFLRLF